MQIIKVNSNNISIDDSIHFTTTPFPSSSSSSSETGPESSSMTGTNYEQNNGDLEDNDNDDGMSGGEDNEATLNDAMAISLVSIEDSNNGTMSVSQRDFSQDSLDRTNR